jgi:Transglycosylase SLT domain
MAIASINGAASPIAGAIKAAARSTGTSFEYLLTTAQIESNLNPAAQAATSSAKGLYQFIDQTWLATMKQAGAALGLSQYANAIVQAPDGSYAVPDTNARAAIMKLRSDPKVSATLAGVFTRSNAAKLAGSIGRTPSEGELYIAHFLGPDGAAKLITTAASSPNTNAAALFPAAAAANRSIFYDRAGHPLGAAAVYGKLTGRYEMARTLAFTPGAPNAPSAPSVADAPSLPSATSVAEAPVPQPPMPIVPDTAGVTQAYADARAPVPLPLPLPPPSNLPVQEGKPLFQAMFTDVPRQGVSSTVKKLWAPAKAEPQPAAQPSSLYDLFKDPQPAMRRSAGGKV